jgi:putative MATE family efflux protein
MSEETKTVKITLDDLPRGDEENDYGRNERYTRQLPPGVTNGMIYRDIVRIGWPAFLELMLMQLVGMFDQIQVGTLGPYAISAVGMANQPRFLLMTAFMSMNTGMMAMVARARGQKDRDRARMMLRQGIILNTISGIVLSILGYIFARSLVLLMGGKDPMVIDAAVRYFRVGQFGMLQIALTSAFTSAFRGIGNSRISLIYNTISNLVNVFLNYCLIGGHLGFPRLEIVGAALATVIGQTVAFIIALVAITKKSNYVYISFEKGNFKPNRLALQDIVHIGLPAAGEQLIMRAGMILYTRVVAGLGTTMHATHMICMNIQALSFMNGQAFAVSSTSLVGQSLGKHRPDMAQAYSKRRQNTGFVVAAIFAAIFVFFGRNIVSLYTDVDEVINMGAEILLMVAVMQPFQASQLILAGSMRGAGDTRVVAYITGFTMLIVRPLTAYVLVNKMHMGLVGAWIAMMADQALRTILVFARYRSGKWKTSFHPASERA